MKDKKLRIEDALNATKAAVEEGIVAGGGTATINAIPAVDKLVSELEGDERTGAKIVRKALEAPLRQIAANAGLEGSVIINKVRESEVGVGFDALKEEYVDMVSAGILDPAKVTRSALQNATSVASTLLTTESVVANIKEDTPAMPAGGAGMGGNGSRIRFQTNGGGNPNLNDIFSMFGGGAGGPGAGSAYERYGADDYEQPQPENGEDRNSKIRLTFRQAVKGATVSLSADGKKFKTHIPAGVHDGQKIRLTGKGKPGRNGGKNGDLYLHITVAEDPKFTLRGRDIIMPLPITVSQAVNGAKVTAKDIDGNEITFKVPAGSSSGAEVRIAGKGVANPHENGDLVGRVEIRIPEHPNLVAKHAAKEFDKACGDFADELARER